MNFKLAFATALVFLVSRAHAADTKITLSLQAHYCQADGKFVSVIGGTNLGLDQVTKKIVFSDSTLSAMTETLVVPQHKGCSAAIHSNILIEDRKLIASVAEVIGAQELQDKCNIV